MERSSRNSRGSVGSVSSVHSDPGSFSYQSQGTLRRGSLSSTQNHKVSVRRRKGHGGRWSSRLGKMLSKRRSGQYRLGKK
uniref:ORF3 n=1 Tax=Strongyloides papillosus TaxID=174720 RepID=A0A0N5B702_STREA